ncbi:fimbria/pilus outer membrane usher protein [Caballeronia calidae]|uniref:fimbria/pilus outer membrane usher protein n=1 Tax=Caballeronia calidae TaxID=1777139 RepID=UPI0012FD6D66|nr:fimbria/pilus outer membrane usher protein [Caballeronia calidae]
MFLETKLNGALLDGLFHFTLHTDGTLYVAKATLAQLGVALPPSLQQAALVNLSNLERASVHYDEPLQRIDIVVPVEWLTRPIQKIRTSGPEVGYLRPTTTINGALLNYDLYTQHLTNRTMLSATTELRGFTAAMGRWSNTLLSHWNDGASTTLSNVRLDTTWQYDDPATMVSYTLGDLTSSALSWSRSVRIGGIQVGRNFGLQPYRTTSPLPSFAGTAALPSTVDLFINGIKQSTQSVLPGQFELSAPPSVNGAGQAQMNITDVSGVTRTLIFPLYASPQVLKKGLSDWSLEMGALRRSYGVESFDYPGPFVGSGSLRYGLTNSLTLETHAELSGSLQIVGLGAVWLPPMQLGTVSASFARSRANGQHGTQLGLGFQWSNERFNVALNTVRRSQGYRDIGSSEDASFARSSNIAFVGVNSSAGQVGLSWISQSYTGQPTQRYISLSISRPIFEQSNISFNVNRNLSGPGSGIYATLSIPLGRSMNSSVTARRLDNGSALTTNLTRSIPAEGSGWGWRMQSELGRSDSAQLEGAYVGRYGQLTAGANQFRNPGSPPISTEYADLNGSLILVGAAFYASQRIDDAFAIVDTNGVKDIPVRFQNRLIGQTNSSGLLIVNHLNAYQHNTVSIDTLTLPVDMQVSTTQLDVVPATRSGAVALFKMDPILAVDMTIVDLHGSPLPVSSIVRAQPAPQSATTHDLAGSAMIGFDGALYLENPPSHGILQVTQPDGAMCHIALPELPHQAGLIHLNRLVCAPQHDAGLD